MSTGLPFPDVSPEIFTISLLGMELALRWYALAYIAGILIGWRLAVAAVKRPGLWPANIPPLLIEREGFSYQVPLLLNEAIKFMRM